MKNTWKFTEQPGKIMEKSWNFVSQGKWEPWILDTSFTVSNRETDKVEIELSFVMPCFYLYSYSSVLFTVRKQNCGKLMFSVSHSVHRRGVSLTETGMYSCYRPQRSLGQGNIFTAVCDSVNRGEGSRSPPKEADTPPRGRHPPPPPDTVIERPVRILLECILVVPYVCFHSYCKFLQM